MAEVFEFEDYFLSPEDRGIEVVVTLNKHTDKGIVKTPVPLRIRKGLDLESGVAAQKRGFTYKLDLESGKPTDVQINETEIQVATLAALILEWPFTRNGHKVPVNEKHVRMMFGDNVQALMEEINKEIEAKKEAIEVPFESR